MNYQFETIHPFLDGNGRVGRLMITLYLVEKGILKKPVLYLSDFFERNGTLYYDNLTRVREKNDLAQWFRFFLVGVIETAKSSIMALDSILKLQKEIDSKLQTLGSRSANAQAIVNDLFQHPILYAQKAKEIAGARRGKFYLFRKYIKLFK